MTLAVDVRFDTASATRFLRVLGSRGVRNATRLALNKAAPQVRTEASKSIRAKRNLKARTVNAQMKVRRASMSRLQASVDVSGKPIPLQDYGAKKRVVRKGGRKYAGVSVAVDRGKRRLVRGAFFGPRGNVFQRLGEKRTPIGDRAQQTQSRLLGPSLPATFLRREIVRAMRTRVATVYPRLLRHEVEREIARAAR